ncbi:MAG: hypothetical protein GX762_01145 [Bacteroidales bacterium]|jgi:F0F1-type ATP synthase assembly protein I|nr:hypothetical protein [Bacteroidales bacterium]
MNRKQKIIRVLYILIGLIVAAAIYFYFTLPPWKAIFLAGSGAILILNLVFAIFFIKRNFKG